MQLLLTIVAFLIIDGIWIFFVANPLYKNHLSNTFLADPVRVGYALLFYLLYAFSLWYLFIKRADGVSGQLLLDVALFGITAYGTYALTNMAIIREWNLQVTLPDLLWGGVLSVLVTLVVCTLCKN